MRLRNYMSITLAILICAMGARGQDRLTAPLPSASLSLKTCIDLALENNESIRRSVIAREVSQLNLGVTRADYSPLVSMNNTSRRNYTRGIDSIIIGNQDFGTQRVIENERWSNDLSTVLSKRWQSGLEGSVTGSVPYVKDENTRNSVDLSLRYPLTSRRRAEIREQVENSRLSMEQQANNEVVTREDVRMAVISTYYSVLQASEELGIVRDFYSQSFAIMKRNQELTPRVVAPLQLDESKIEVDRRQANLISSLDQFESRRESLNVLMGLPVDASYELQEKLQIRANESPLQTWIDRTLKSNRTIQNFDKSLQQQDNSLQVTSRLNDPEVTLGATAQRNEEGEELFAIDLTLSWPIYDGKVRNMLTRAAKKDINSTKIARWNYERQLTQAVRSDYRALQTEWQLCNILGRSVELAERNLNIAREQYEDGKLPYRNFVDIQIDLASTRSSLVGAKVSYKVALASLESRIHD
jgi:outer membrane protein